MPRIQIRFYAEQLANEYALKGYFIKVAVPPQTDARAKLPHYLPILSELLLHL